MHFAEGSRVLLVGEGDFSFSTSLAGLVNSADVHLTATALQEHLTERAKGNVEALTERGVKVVLGVDATRLHLHPLIQHLTFTHVVFNFPHVGGKMRIDLNRKLLRDFFRSSVEVLDADGCVAVTLCGGQAGVTPDPTLRRWDDTWKAVLMASYADLVLRAVERFNARRFLGYSATGYRSLEKSFCLEGALTLKFRVCKLSPEPACALTTEDVRLSDGGCLALPSFLHSLIQRDVISDRTSFLGHFYDLLVSMLSANFTVRLQDKLIFAREMQNVSLRKCASVSECAGEGNAIFCHPSYRIDTEERLRVQPLIVLFSSEGTGLESLLSETVSLNVRNVSRSLTPKTRKFAFIDFTEFCFCDESREGSGCGVTCYVVNLSALARQCGGVEEEEVWAEGQTVNLNNNIITYSQFSLCPVEYTYDLSFWDSTSSSESAISNGSLEKSVVAVIVNVGRDALKDYWLTSTYGHPVLRRRSYTYRIVYRSWHGALSDEGAKKVHRQIGKQLEKCLGVEVR